MGTWNSRDRETVSGTDFGDRMGVVADSSRNPLSTRSMWRATGASREFQVHIHPRARVETVRTTEAARCARSPTSSNLGKWNGKNLPLGCVLHNHGEVGVVVATISNLADDPH